MKYYHCILTMMCLLLLQACNKQKEGEDFSDPAESAEAYYNLLTLEQYGRFVSGMANADNMPDDYREQMELLVQQQMETRWQKHGQWKSIDAIDTQLYGANSDSANVFLSISYADSTQERIMVPMVCLEDEWFMQ
ncbi:MAG: hypothetical protein J5486_08225 [Bacteroidaceae bacterium]|nr:hypothetical protein [Bacteroidaceae bacterium]